MAVGEGRVGMDLGEEGWRLVGGRSILKAFGRVEALRGGTMVGEGSGRWRRE